MPSIKPIHCLSNLLSYIDEVLLWRAKEKHGYSQDLADEPRGEGRRQAG
jgi:hypothetical protein